MHWQEALALLDERGWDGDRVLDEELHLLESPLFEPFMPPEFVARAVRDAVDEWEARALLAVTQAWIVKDDATGEEVRASVRRLRRS